MLVDKILKIFSIFDVVLILSIKWIDEERKNQTFQVKGIETCGFFSDFQLYNPPSKLGSIFDW